MIEEYIQAIINLAMLKNMTPDECIEIARTTGYSSTWSDAWYLAAAARERRLSDERRANES